MSVKVLLLDAQDEEEHASLLLKHQAGERPDRREELSLLSGFVGEGIEPEQNAVPLLVRFVQVGDGVLDTLHVCERGTRPTAIGRNGGGVVPVSARLKGQGEKSSSGRLEGNRAGGLCPEGGPGLCDLIQGHPLRVRAERGFLVVAIGG